MELIVGMILFTIVTAAVSAVMMPMLRTYARANELAEMNTLIYWYKTSTVGSVNPTAATQSVPLTERHGRSYPTATAELITTKSHRLYYP